MKSLFALALLGQSRALAIKEGRCPAIPHRGDMLDGGEAFDPAKVLEGPWVSLLEEKESLRDFQCLASIFKSFDSDKLAEHAPAENRRIMHLLHSNTLSAETQEEVEREGD